MRKVNHTHKNHGKSGMVYWDIENLIKIADYPLITRAEALA